jgi:hypothetical protein
MKLNNYSSFLLGCYVFMIFFWIAIQQEKSINTNLPVNFMFSFGLNSISFIGGIFGIIISKGWGRFKSAIGKGVFYVGAGLVSWGIGGYIWSFYNFVLHQSVPYPSLSDLGFVGAVPLWMMGVWYMSKATGVKYGLKNNFGKFSLIVFPIISLLVSYYLLVTVARAGTITQGGGFLKVIFDFAYPLSDVVILTIALLVYGLSFKYLGGRFKWPVIITLIGFLVEYFADFSFSYTTTINTYFNGSYPDMLFTTSLFLMSFGIASFYTEKS